jgi:sulfur carrier protein
MNIRINGKPETIDALSDVEALISGKGLSADRVVVEYNQKILPREEWAGTAVREGDNIEIVSFVGGG